MTCETVERDNIIERYLSGRLDSSLREEWEQHYFGCDECAAKLETCMTVREPLSAMADEIRKEMPRRAANRQWLWAGAAIAAGLLAAAGLRFTGHPTPSASPAVQAGDTLQTQRRQLTELARLDPPAYAPVLMRGAASQAHAQFEDAMKAYSRREYREAISGLQAALQLNPSLDAARFFLGACQLLTGDLEAGTRELRAVANGQSPFAEEAAFDSAKGYLLQGDKSTALGVLNRIAAGNGEYAARARELAAQVEAIR